MNVAVESYRRKDLDQVQSILAAAFVTSPLHLSVFGADRLDQNRLFFRIGLRNMFTGHARVARVNDEICGYVHFNESPYCLPAPEEVPGVMATLLKPLGSATPKVIAWFARWCRLDPDEPHVHLGPIAVAPEFQGQGVGSTLMERYIEYLEQNKMAGYLETDKAVNVRFYEKFGFKVCLEEELIGTPVWYMWRETPGERRPR